MSGGRFDTLLSQVQARLEALETLTTGMPTAPADTLRTSLVQGKRHLVTIENNVKEMERLIQTMPLRDREFFQADLVACRDGLSQQKARMDALEPEVRRRIAEDVKRRQELGPDIDLVMGTRDGIDQLQATLNNGIAINKDTIQSQEHTTAVLADDRQRLGHIQSNLDVIDGEAEKGFGRAARMLIRQVCMGWGAWLIDILLFCVLVIVLLAKLGLWSYIKNR
jgi:hypothetical protein